MSRVHQIELIVLILSFAVAHFQSQERLFDQRIAFMEDCPSKTHWDQVPYKTLRAFFWIHILFAFIVGAGKCLGLLWTWLGGL